MASCQMRTLGLAAGQTVSSQTKEDYLCLFSIWVHSILARHDCVLGSLFEELTVGILLFECLEKFGYLSTRNPRAGLMTLSQRLNLVLPLKENKQMCLPWLNGV